MFVYDLRVIGVAPAYADNTYRVNQWTSTRLAFGWMADYARERGGLDSLDILCHGLVTERGAWAGIALGDTVLNEHSIGTMVSPFRPGGRSLVRIIRLFSCSGAGNTNGQLLLDAQSQIDHGWLFAQKFANNSGAIVVAARDTQRYSVADGIIDLGRWEGHVVHFHPNNTTYARPAAQN